MVTKVGTKIQKMNTQTVAAGSQPLAGLLLDRSAQNSAAKVIASLNYYNDPGDGSLPEPVYVKR